MFADIRSAKASSHASGRAALNGGKQTRPISHSADADKAIRASAFLIVPRGYRRDH